MTIASNIAADNPISATKIIDEFRKKFPNVIGQVSHELTVSGIAGVFPKKQSTNTGPLIVYLSCHCSCGKDIVIRAASLRSGGTRSCGHLRTEQIRKIAGINRKSHQEREVSLLLSRYRHGAVRRGLTFELSDEQASALFEQDCYYCGAAPSYPASHRGATDRKGYAYNGIDRMDNALPYRVGNVVACCTDCNTAKADSAQEEFLAWVAQVLVFRAYPRHTYAIADPITRQETRRGQPVLPRGYAARNQVVNNYLRAVRYRRLAYELPDPLAHWLLEQDCFYCGCPPSQVMKYQQEKSGSYVYNGIDRVDNKQGYLPDNVVTCCGTCNYRKLTKNREEFYAWVERIGNHQGDSLKRFRFVPPTIRPGVPLAHGPDNDTPVFSAKVVARQFLPGEQFGRLRIIERVGDFLLPISGSEYRCSCTCGNESTATHKYLMALKEKSSCGCGLVDARVARRGKEIPAGTVFHQITVLNLLGYRPISSGQPTNTAAWYQCRCICGKEWSVLGTRLRNGSTKGCGCTLSRSSRIRPMKEMVDTSGGD